MIWYERGGAYSCVLHCRLIKAHTGTFMWWLRASKCRSSFRYIFNILLLIKVFVTYKKSVSILPLFDKVYVFFKSLTRYFHSQNNKILYNFFLKKITLYFLKVWSNILYKDAYVPISFSVNLVKFDGLINNSIITLGSFVTR